MKAVNRIFLVAILAGGIAGLFLAEIQYFMLVPMVIEAETYDTANVNEHDWLSTDSTKQIFFIAAQRVIAGIGFGLLLTACYSFCRAITLRSGIWWGLAGFTAFHFSPALGLPPELPADVVEGSGMRQVWWLLTVITTAAGLWLIVFQSSYYQKLLGATIIILPHLFGVPQAEVYCGLAPEGLRSDFIHTSLITNAIFWIVLGPLSAYFFNRTRSNINEL